MWKSFRSELRRPTFWIAIAALLSSLMGTAFAAGMIGSAEIRDGSVRSEDIHDDQVFSADIRNLSVGAADIAENAITSTKIKNGTIRRGDLGAGAVTASSLGAGAVTSSSLGVAAVEAGALAPGSVTETALDPAFARVYTLSGLTTPGAAEQVMLTKGGFEFALRCDDLGGGERSTEFVIRRSDGSVAWGLGGVRHFIDIGSPGSDPSDPLGGGGIAAMTFSNPSSTRNAEFYELFLSTLDSMRAYRLTAISTNMFGSDPVCAVAGTLVPIDVS